MKKSLLFAHRGASMELPENTIEAFARGLSLGADAIETDVHVTRDDVVVTHHDDTTSRMCGERHVVAELLYAELARLDASVGHGTFGGGDLRRPHRIPRFEEALEAFPEARFNVDVKDGARLSAVVRVIERQRAAGRVLLTSFHDRVVKAIRKSYQGQTGLARREAMVALAAPRVTPNWLLPEGDRIQLPAAVWGRSLLRAALIKRLQSFGLKVDFWVINDADQARTAHALGVDGVMTDDPRTVAPALGKTSARSSARA